MICLENIPVCEDETLDTHTPTRHMQQQRAQARKLGPDLVLVLTWCWQWTQVRSTGPSLSSVGTTSWVATGGGALWTGPISVLESEYFNILDCKHIWKLYNLLNFVACKNISENCSLR